MKIFKPFHVSFSKREITTYFHVVKNIVEQAASMEIIMIIYIKSVSPWQRHGIRPSKVMRSPVGYKLYLSACNPQQAFISVDCPYFGKQPGGHGFYINHNGIHLGPDISYCPFF